jgi:hypothetical protein
VIEPRDVLRDLTLGNVTEPEVEALYDRIMDSGQARDVRRLLMLSKQEVDSLCSGRIICVVSAMASHRVASTVHKLREADRR